MRARGPVDEVRVVCEGCRTSLASRFDATDWGRSGSLLAIGQLKLQLL